MKNAKQIFHITSYAQYPLMLIGLYFCCRPLILNDLNSLWTEYNKALIFYGLGISFATLQDTSKVQNEFSRRIYANPKSSRIFLLTIVILISFFIGFGLFGYFVSDNATVREVSFGCIVLGIGMMGMLKSAIEMAEIHKKETVAERLEEA